MRAEDILKEYAEVVDKEMEKLFENRRYLLYDMMRYHLGWLDENLRKVEQYRGKRFRPTLCLLVYSSIAGVYDKALPAAVAIELIHNFSLIHDDIEDMDEERRHKPTVWKLFGIPHAINAGDGMHVLANIAALRLRERYVSSDKILDVLEILNNAVMNLCEGQFLDISFQDRDTITMQEYMEMIYKKTASLIEASCKIGAILATDDEEIVNRFSSFGRNIGLAFQIVDDIIGIWGKEEKTGKPVASDIRNKKKSMPIVCVFESDRRDEIVEIYRKEKLSEEDIEKVLNILNELNILEVCKKEAEKFKKIALEELEKTGIKNESIEKIKTLAEFLIEREY